MSASRTSKSGIFDGRLNLEQQRKRAKELLKSARAQQGDAQTRISIHLPGKSIEDLQLADSQIVIARENGFASWPKLKSHIDRITEHQRQIASGHLPKLDTVQTLHLRCGSDISHCLKLAGVVGAFMEFSDPFCQGPVPDVPLPDFIETRARFIASSYRIDFPDAFSRLQREYAGLATLGDYDHVVLWFDLCGSGARGRAFHRPRSAFARIADLVLGKCPCAGFGCHAGLWPNGLARDPSIKARCAARHNR